MKILMFAPAFGHNIKPFLNYYSSEDFSLTVAFSGKNSLSDVYPNVDFIKVSPLSMLKLFFRIYRRDFDLLWLHGGNRLSIPIGIFLRLFRPSVFSIFNVWGEGVLKKAEQSKLYSFFFGASVSGYALVQFNWITLERMFKSKYPAIKTKTLLWGVTDEYFNSNRSPKLIAEIDSLVSGSHYKLFFPKTISTHSNHFLLLEALEKVNLPDWHLYLLEGNGRDTLLYSKLKAEIEHLGLTQRVTFLEFTDYLNPSEMAYLWGKMECGLQIVESDQLSNTLIEPQIFCKEVLASNIEQYRDFNNFFNLDIPLVQNNAQELSGMLTLLISGDYRTSDEQLNKRLITLRERYSFNHNVELINKYHEKCLREVSNS